MTDMAKKPAAAAPESFQVTLKVTTRLVERADDLIDHVSEAVFRHSETGQTATRADVWREAILRGLKSLEKDREK